jgi:hypothetical protein
VPCVCVYEWDTIVVECSVDVNRKMQVASRITICGDMTHATANEYEALSQIKLLRRRDPVYQMVRTATS